MPVKILLTTVAVSLAAGGAHAAIMVNQIDDYSEPLTGVELQTGMGGTASETNGLTSPPALFDTRTSTLEQTSRSGSRIEINAGGGGVLEFTQPASLAGPVEATASFAYSNAGGGAIDLTAGGASGIAFDTLVTASSGAPSISLSVVSGSGAGTQTSTFTKTISPGMMMAPDMFVDFGLFTGGADFTNATQLIVEFFGDDGSDFVFDNLQTARVPVPAALPMMLAGLGGLAWMARRRRSADAA